MTPNLGGYPDIPYLFGYQVGGMVPGYQDALTVPVFDGVPAFDDPDQLAYYESVGTTQDQLDYLFAPEVTDDIRNVSIKVGNTTYPFEYIPADAAGLYGIKYNPNTGKYITNFDDEPGRMDDFIRYVDDLTSEENRKAVHERVESLYSKEDFPRLKSYKPISLDPFAFGFVEEEDKLVNTGEQRIEMGEEVGDITDAIRSPEDLELYMENMFYIK